MAMDHNSSGRRPHYHRGRRGTDRRGNDRRTPQQSPDQVARPSGDHTDVELIMREIRSRISQRGIELSTQQIQDLAGRRLEAILDPRNISPTLLDQLRKGAAAQPDPLPRTADSEHSISDDAIYDGGAVLRFFRRLLNPLLKLLFNPAPLVAALQAQAKINRDAATRAVEHERRQTEWNALHYQILQRLVTEVSRNSIEMQSLTMRVEALSARVDFNDRRVRALETAPAPSRSQRPQEVVPVATPTSSPSVATESAVAPVAPVSTPDGPRRKRRRRRGRRGSISALGSGGVPAAATVETPDDGSDLDEGDDEEALEIPAVTEPTSESLSSEPTPSVEPEAEAPSEPPSPEPMAVLSPEPVAPPFPEPVAPSAQTPMSEPAPVTPIPPRDPGTPEH